MKIDISKIPPQGLEITQDFDARVLDLERIDITFASLLKVKAELRKIVNVVSAQVWVKAKILAICSRCLKEEERDFSQTYKLNYEIKKEDRFIDLEPDLREEIIVGYPLSLLCKPDCNGLCRKCGKNLNLGPCDCEKKEIKLCHYPKEDILKPAAGKEEPSGN